MAFKTENLLTSFYIPQLRRVVHGARRHEHAVRIERQADNLHLVTLQCVI